MIATDPFFQYKMGRRCPFCDHAKTYKMGDERRKCRHCKTKYSLKKLRNDLSILYYFYLETSARKTAKEMHVSYKSIYARFMHFRKCISAYLEVQFAELNGDLEIDESYFGGKQKGKRGRIPNAKAETLIKVSHRLTNILK